MPQPDVKKISCKRCQTRKIKCSRTSPCGRCTSAGVKCEFRGEDSKRCPISREYVGALESRIANLELFLSELQSASVDERDNLLDKIVFIDHLPPVASSKIPTPRSETSEILGLDRKIASEETEDDFSTPQGIYGTKIMHSYNSISPTRRVYGPLSSSRTGFTRPHIEECLALFFRWQNPCSMILNRDDFLVDYINDEFGRSDSGQALVHSACALGCLMSTNRSIRQMADQFYNSAAHLLLRKSLLTSHIWTVQALLCCALYQIGSGNSSAGWMFSGMAIRMAQDLGLRRDLERIFPEAGVVRTSLIDTESRRRMLSNCYISDKIFGLMMGQPSTMLRSDENSSPTRTNSLNQPRIFDIWLEKTGLSEYREVEGAPDPSSIMDKEFQLAAVLEHITLWNLNSAPRSKRWIEIELDNINSKLCKWHDSIPSNQRWDRWGSRFDAIHPSIASLHMLYHTARLSLNGPFITYPCPELAENAIKICDASVDTIVSILHRFKQQHSLKNAPLSFVHGAIRAADTNLALSRHLPHAQNTNLQALESALSELSYSWEVAAHAHEGLRNLLLEIEFEKQDGRSVASSSLDSEVDTLLGFSPNEHLVLGEQNLGLEGQSSYICNDFNGSYEAIWDPMLFADDSLSFPIGIEVGGKNNDPLDLYR